MGEEYFQVFRLREESSYRSFFTLSLSLALADRSVGRLVARCALCIRLSVTVSLLSMRIIAKGTEVQRKEGGKTGRDFLSHRKTSFQGCPNRIVRERVDQRNPRLQVIADRTVGRSGENL